MRAASAELFARYWPHARKMISCKEDAEDLLGSAYLVARRYADESDPDFHRRFYGAMRVLVTTNSFRKRSAREDDHMPLEEAWHWVESWEEEVIERQWLTAIFSRLPRIQQVTLLLFAAGYSHKQIADYCHTRPETVNTRIQEARKKLSRWAKTQN